MAQQSARPSTHEQRTQQEEPQHIQEDKATKMIERQTARLPSNIYLIAALGSMAGSAYLQWKGKKEESLFVGQWAPAFLTIGVYNKMVKLLGSD